MIFKKKKNLSENNISDNADEEIFPLTSINKDHLLNALLPNDEFTKELVLTLYSDEKNAVQRTITMAFERANPHMMGNNLKPLIEYCLNSSYGVSFCNENKDLISSLQKELRCVIEEIESKVNYCIEIKDREMYKENFKNANSLFRRATNCPDKVTFYDYFHMAYECFDMINDSTHTFRYLYAVASVCNWNDDITQKDKLCDIILGFQKNGKGESIMNINPLNISTIEVTFKESDNFTEVYANEVSIGNLIRVSGNWLNWAPTHATNIVSFQFRKKETFVSVVEQLRNYKDCQDCEYLVISDYASIIDKSWLDEVGFKQLPNAPKDLYFLK